MKKDMRPFTFLLITLLALLTACNMPGARSDATTTIDATQAYQTIEAILTQDATQKPSTTTPSSPTVTITPPILPGTATPSATPTRTSLPTSTSPVTQCDQAAPGVPIDVTIPDDTKMQPGQTFTKVWRLQNSGTCNWTKNYSVAVFSGEAMGAPTSVPMPSNVAPGQSVDISVDLVAPQTAGTYQGNWKLRNATGTWFGIGPGGASPFWVRIVVTSSSTTQTVTVTAPAPTNSPTPLVLVTGTTPLIPTDRLNLDSNQVNAGGGEDLSYETNQDGQPLITPIGGALIGVFGQGTPTLANCQSTPLGALPLLLENLPQGLYVCYRTDQGNPGWARLLNFNQNNLTLTLQILTWTNQ